MCQVSLAMSREFYTNLLMNKMLIKKPQVGATLKAAIALYLWKFKKNALVLLPVIFLQIYVQYKVLNLLPSLSASNETQAFASLFVVLGWYALSSILLFMAYADITRRLCGLSVRLDNVQARLAYAYWLFKKAITVITLLLMMFITGALILIVFAIVMGLALRTLGAAVSTEPPAWLSITIMVVGLSISIFLITHLALMCFPIAIDKNDGPIDSMRRGIALIKPCRHYGHQMAMILFMAAILPNMLIGSLSAFFSITPGMPVSQFLLPGLISTSIGVFVAFFLLCLQLAIYRQLESSS